MIKLDAALAGITHLGLDSAPIICFMEARPQFDRVVTEIFRRIDSRAILGVTSIISLLEVLVLPMRRGYRRLQDQYRDLWLASDNFRSVHVSADIAVNAADLRA